MPKTIYTIRNRWGVPLFRTADTEEVELFRDTDCEVTAVTQGETA